MTKDPSRFDLLPTVKDAVEQLGNPNVLWLRGHSEFHKLVPWLFRFPDGVAKEDSIAKLSSFYDGVSFRSHVGLPGLVQMHHRYRPGRLLAWTESLLVALFCAVAREDGRPTLFLLDPLRLNSESAILKLPVIGTSNGEIDYFSGWPKNPFLPKLPIAIDGRFATDKANSEALFTVHGSDGSALEALCPDCVRRVVLTEAEKLSAMEHLVSGQEC
jgi:hypothetical protein